MNEISFIYKINNDVNINFGKIKLNYIPEQHLGLDLFIKPDVWNCITNGLNKDETLYHLTIGVIGILVDNMYATHYTCTATEINIFTVYIYEQLNNTYYYYNGKNVTTKSETLVLRESNDLYISSFDEYDDEVEIESESDLEYEC
jgi:hypothetical protein